MAVFLRLLVSRGNNEWYASSCGRAVSGLVVSRGNPAVVERGIGSLLGITWRVAWAFFCNSSRSRSGRKKS